MTQAQIEVTATDNETEGRYAVALPGIDDEAELTWHARGPGVPGVIVADHTYAPDAMRGTGVAAAMVACLISDARAKGVRIVPACSYVLAQFERHPEWSDVLAD